MENIQWLDKPISVNIGEWSISHPGCDTLISKNRPDTRQITAIAYALNKNGNIEISNLARQNAEFGIWGGVDESVFNRLGV